MRSGETSVGFCQPGVGGDLQSTAPMLIAAICAGWLLAAIRLPASAGSTPHALQTTLDDRGRQITEYMHALQAAAAGCEWEEVLRISASVFALAPRASDAWFEACARALTAHNELWEPEKISVLAREVLAARTIRERGDPATGGARIDPIGPRTRSHLATAELGLARVHQARSEHEAALELLHSLIADLRERPCDDAHFVLARAGIAAGRGLLLVGRSSEARQALESLRDDLRGSPQAAVACVLLQQGSDGVDAYRGEFEGDPRHRERMLALRDALPRARARLAARLRRPERELPHFPVGVADAPAGRTESGGLTSGDPRVPDFAPVITIFSETLALELFEPEQVLVHELTHALLMTELGLRYERLPSWLIEGIPEGVAEQWEPNLDRLLGRWLFADPQAFLRADFWAHHDLTPSTDPCGRRFAVHDGVLLSSLERQHGEGRLMHLLANLRGPEPLERAFSHVAGGKSPVEFERSALAELRQHLEVRRQAALPLLAALLEACVDGPASAAQRAEQVLAGAPPSFVGEFARWQIAEALEALGRHEEALVAYDRLRGPEHAGFAEVLRVARARCLLQMQRKDEAARELQDLRRAALGEDIARWAAEQLGELERRSGRR